MEEIKAPKKERKFLKAIGNIGKVLAEELVMGIARKFIGKAIDKVGNKKQGLVIAFIVLASSFVFAQYPTNPNKQRLGFQTTADGLVWRGSLSDTASIQPVSNQNAWVILDTVNLKIYSFDFTSNVWGLVGGGSAAFTQPIDSLFFNVNVPTNNVDTAKMRWDSDLATVVLGLNDNVANELGFKNFWLVKNQTGSTITKGSLVYANGTVGASGRITVAKFIANGTIDAKYLLGITAHDLSNGEDGYVISFGKIRQVNTDTFAAGAILYPSPTVAGVWTDVEPIAPNLDMPIGFCINSSSNNGTIAIRVASGYKLSELHDLAISSPVTNASLYYSGGLWRDTTATLLVSDTATMLSNYATKAYADTSGRFYARQDFTNVSSSTLTWTQSDTLVVGGVNVVQVYRNGQILLPTQYTIPTNASVVIGATAYKVGENYTVIFPRGGGAGSGGGSGSLTSISGGTGILVSPDPITTTGTVSADLSVLMELTDTSLLNLTTRFATKQNTLVSGTDIKTINSNNLLGSGNISVGTLVGTDTVSLSNRINTKLNPTDTVSLSNRINLKLNPVDTISLSNRINAKGTGTVTSIATGYGLNGGTINTAGTLLLDSAVVFSRIRDSIVDVAIGNDTIKILKQEYQPALSSVLTWTITPKFPIQLKAYILVFRNGQLLNNDQYNLTDTNKITIVSTSFKVGANYTVATVSGIGSIGTGVFPNPVYPEAGIALSTGSAWASSIPNNSSNWNIAYNDKINNAAFSGTTTKTLTLTQLDGGTITAPFTDLQGVTGVTAGTGLTGGTITTTGTLAADTNLLVTRFDTSAMLTNYLRSGVAASTYVPLNTESTMNATLNINGNLSLLTGGILTTPLLSAGTIIKQGGTTSQFLKANGDVDANSYLRTGLADSTYLKLTGGTLTGGLTGTSAIFSGNVAIGFPFAYKPFEVFSNVNDFVSVGVTTLSPYAWSGIHFGYREANSVYRKSAIVFQRNEAGPADASGKIHLLNVNSFEGGRNADLRDAKLTIGNNGFVGINDTTPSYNLDVNGTLGVTGAATLSSTLAVTGDITENGNNVLTSADTTNMLLPYFRDTDTTSLNLTSRFEGKLNLSDTIKLTTFGTSNAATLINKTLNIPNYKTLNVTNPLQDYLVKFSDAIGAGIQRSNISESGTTVDMASSDVKLGAIKNNGTFSSPITVSTNCGSSGSPNLIGTSTGNYVNNCSSGTAYILLPDPADVSGFTVGRILTITNLRSGQSIVLNTSGSYSNARPLGIDGASESSIPAKRWITVQSNGLNWYIIATGSAL
jgi:hypothetical protein